MIRLFVTAKVDATRKALQTYRDAIPGKVEQAFERFALAVIGEAKENFLSGPRPEKLGVVTGRLRNSLAYRITERASATELRVGTNVPYAARWEFGRRPGAARSRRSRARAITDLVGRAIRGKGVDARPFLTPAFKKEAPLLEARLRMLLQSGWAQGTA